VLIALIAFSVAGGLFGLYEYKRRQKGESVKAAAPLPEVKRRTA
jgi:hypothetical protein